MTYTILIVEDEYLVRQGLTKLVNVAVYDIGKSSVKLKMEGRLGN